MSINPAADNFLLITCRLASLAVSVVVISGAGDSLDGGEFASFTGEDRSSSGSSVIIVAVSIALLLYIWKSINYF